MAGVSDNVEACIAKIEENLDEFMQAFAAEFLERVQQKTPVLTGRLRDGWVADVNGTELIVSNDVEYAEYIENGTPHIAPFGMLKQTVAEAEDIEAIAVARVKS